MRFKAILSLLLGLCLMCSLSGFAQETTGTITGFVKDKTGAVIPSVEIKIRNVDTGLERKTQSGAGGEYTVTQLQIGKYQISVERTGFKNHIVRDITLNVNDRLRIDPILEVGAAAETVTVESTPSEVQTESSTVGNTISGKKVLELPLNGRSLFQLIALQPGVSASSSIVSGRVGVGLDNLASVNVNGGRSSQNNWVLDGADNNDTGSNQSVINYVSIESVSEFKILRGNYDAEFGRSSGGQINVVSKSGGNQYHGGAFEFFRNDAMDARNYFKPSCDSLAAQGKQVVKGANCGASLLRYHNFGGNIGGPIVKDKLFFFFNEEVRKVRTVRGGGVVNTRVPTDLQKQGIFTTTIKDPLTGVAFLNNTIPANRIDPRAQALLGLWPSANSTPALLGGVLNYTASTPSGRNYREELGKLDYNLSENHRLFIRYVQDSIPSTEPFNEVFGTSNSNLPGIYSSATSIKGKNLVAEWNWLVSNNMVNNFAFNYSKGAIFANFTGNGLRSNFAGFNSPEAFPANAIGALPSILITGYAGWGANSGGPFAPYFNTYGSHRFKDTFSMTKGKHAIKAGYLFSWEFKNEDNGGSSATAGQFTFPGATSGGFVSSGDAFADFLMGRASAYVESNIDVFSHLRYNMHEAFVQDDWKVLPNLTINAGVRWSYILPPTDAQNVLTNFVPSMFDPAKAPTITAGGLRGPCAPPACDPLDGVIIAGVNSPYGDAVTNSHANTFGPRLGFAWDPFKDGKMAVRGGYGIYFDRTLSGIALQNAFLNPPFVVQGSFSALSAAVTPTLGSPTSGTAVDPTTLVPNLTTMSPDFKIPTSQQWNLGVQQQLPGGIFMDLSYVGNHGTHLLRALRINQTPAGAATTAAAARAIAKYRGWGTISERNTSSSSRYDSLQLSVNKKMTHGLQFGFAYTWSKVITDSPSDRSDFPQDINNLAAERALASFDKNHVFVGNLLYDLPFFNRSRQAVYNLIGGWQIGGLYRAEAGLPLTIFETSPTANSFFNGSIRPNLVGDPHGAHTILQWFNPAAFAFAPTNTYGNAPRSVVRGPGINLADIAIYKNFRVTESVKMQFRADLFNAFNHTNFNAVSTNVDSKFFTAPSTSATPQFGQVTSSLEPRQIQLGLKLNF